jgi:hypothetical protein
MGMGDDNTHHLSVGGLYICFLGSGIPPGTRKDIPQISHTAHRVTLS